MINKDRFWTSVELIAENVDVYYNSLTLSHGYQDTSKTNPPDISLVPSITIHEGMKGYAWFGNYDFGRVEATLNFEMPHERGAGFSLSIRSSASKNGNHAYAEQVSEGYLVDVRADNLNGMGAMGKVIVRVSKK